MCDTTHCPSPRSPVSSAGNIPKHLSISLKSEQTEITASLSPHPSTGLASVLGHLCYFVPCGFFLDYSPISPYGPKLQPKHLQMFCLLQSLAQCWGLGRHSVPMRCNQGCATPGPAFQIHHKLVKPHTGPLAARDVCIASGLCSSSS